MISSRSGETVTRRQESQLLPIRYVPRTIGNGIRSASSGTRTRYLYICKRNESGDWVSPHLLFQAPMVRRCWAIAARTMEIPAVSLTGEIAGLRKLSRREMRTI